MEKRVERPIMLSKGATLAAPAESGESVNDEKESEGKRGMRDRVSLSLSLSLCEGTRTQSLSHGERPGETDIAPQIFPY